MCATKVVNPQTTQYYNPYYLHHHACANLWGNYLLLPHGSWFSTNDQHYLHAYIEKSVNFWMFVLIIDHNCTAFQICFWAWQVVIHVHGSNATLWWWWYWKFSHDVHLLGRARNGSCSEQFSFSPRTRFPCIIYNWSALIIKKSLHPDDISLVSKDEALKRALTYWNRAAAQGLPGLSLYLWMLMTLHGAKLGSLWC